MYYLTRISSPIAESWVFLVYAALLFMVLLVWQSNASIINVSFSSLFSIKERNSIFVDSTFDVRNNLLTMLVILTIIPLNIYLGIYDGGEFLFINYLKIVGLFVGIAVLKFLSVKLLCYVFFSDAVFQTVWQHYFRLLTALAVVLLPITLVAVFYVQTAQTAVWMLYLAVGLFYLVAMLIKIIQLFFTKILASFYIFLYLCMLEILPLAILLLGSETIIS